MVKACSVRTRPKKPWIVPIEAVSKENKARLSRSAGIIVDQPDIPRSLAVMLSLFLRTDKDFFNLGSNPTRGARRPHAR